MAGLLRYFMQRRTNERAKKHRIGIAATAVLRITGLSEQWKDVNGSRVNA